MTREETIKAFECCYMTYNCKECPLDKQGKCYIRNSGKPEVNKAVMHYLKENEPALSANSTSSEILKNINSTHLDDSTKEQICQAYDTMDEACADIIDIYETMSEREHRAFNIGEVYGKICSTRDKLENMKGAN
ncbi:hypothetical protein [Ruminococcus sp.]|uniref:hypothetical protein n=1 Tax=Ruminococcus sp. TaxID=41978 RepID=UPI002FD9DA6C